MGNTIKSFKKMKDKTFRKTAFVEINNEFKLPIKSLSALESRIKIDYGVEIPSKIVNLTNEEVDKYIKENGGSTVRVKTFQKLVVDETDKEYLKEISKQKDVLDPLVSVAKYVDLNFLNEDGIALWEDLELQSNDDYVGLAKKLFFTEKEGGFELGEIFLTKLSLAIRTLEEDPILLKLSQLEKMYEGKSSFEMLDDLLKIDSLGDEIKELKKRVSELSKVDDTNEKETATGE